jgi:hypothetical protein
MVPAPGDELRGTLHIPFSGISPSLMLVDTERRNGSYAPKAPPFPQGEVLVASPPIACSNQTNDKIVLKGVRISSWGGRWFG